MIGQKHNSSPLNMAPPKAQYNDTIFTTNKKSPPSKGVNSMKIGGMRTLKHDIIPQKFYEILIKTKLKVENDLDFNNFYNHINMCLDAATRI